MWGQPQDLSWLSDCVRGAGRWPPASQVEVPSRATELSDYVCSRLRTLLQAFNKDLDKLFMKCSGDRKSY